MSTQQSNGIRGALMRVSGLGDDLESIRKDVTFIYRRLESIEGTMAELFRAIDALEDAAFPERSNTNEDDDSQGGENGEDSDQVYTPRHVYAEYEEADE